ncbi:MAG TPA: hypothetical protein VME17_16760 [Bryobacteraceae bacterium]|nr:hypothetical protein [Bryobacteraceae bacterium]HTW66279.1 hypothetical protein [Bryobacteraceae bacterium]
MMARVTTLLLLALSVRAAEFQTGQAARAVIGQPSFSAREAGVAVTTLSLSNGKLYAADAAHRLLTFDLNKIPGAKDDLADRQGPCALCGFPAIEQVSQAVLPGVAGVAVFGNTVAMVDTPNHRVLLWPDAAMAHPAQIVLGSNELLEPVSVALDGRRLFVGDTASHRVLVWNALPGTDNQPADAVLGTFSEVPGADTISSPVALVSDGTNLFVGDNADRRILVFTPGDGASHRPSVINSASLAAGALAPGTLVTVSGTALADVPANAEDDGVQRLPAKLGGVEVLFDGVALPLLSVSTTQVRAQLPYDTGNASSASLYVRTEHGDGNVTVTNATAAKLTPTSPGLFAFGGTEPRTGLILHSDGTPERAGTPVTADDPAKAGETLIFWAAGLGAVESPTDKGPVMGVPYAGPDAPAANRVGAVINGRTAQVISATLPERSIGVYEVRIVLPADLPTDANTELLIMQDGSVSNTVTIPVQNTIQ